jgi:hypothetical protein
VKGCISSLGLEIKSQSGVRKESATLRPIRVVIVRKSLIEIEKALLQPVHVFVEDIAESKISCLVV